MKIILFVVVALACLWYLGTTSSYAKVPTGGFKDLCPPGFMLASYTSAAKPCVPLQADMRYRSS